MGILSAMGKRKESKRARRAAMEARQSVQDVLPIKDIDDGILYLRDGSFRIFVDYPGKNYSIFSNEQMKREAKDVSIIISSITCPFSILKYAKTAELQEGLMELEQAIDDARERAIGSRGEVLDRSSMKRLDILERHMLPQALAEASRAEQVGITNVIAFCFGAKTTIDEAERQVQTFCRLAEDRTKVAARRLGSAEVAGLLGEWLTPSSIVPGTSGAGSPVLPSGWEDDDR